MLDHQTSRGVVKRTPPELMIDTGTGLGFETRLDRLPGHLTPLDRFFVRNHAPTPRLDAAGWRLSIDGGGVRKPVTYTYADIWKFPLVSVVRTLECAGNRRSLFGEACGRRFEGTPWGRGAIGTASSRTTCGRRSAGARPVDSARLASGSGFLEVEPDEAPLVPLIFDLFVNNRLGARSIAMSLNELVSQPRSGGMIHAIGDRRRYDSLSCRLWFTFVGPTDQAADISRRP